MAITTLPHGFLGEVLTHLEEADVNADVGDLCRWLASTWERRFADAADASPEAVAEAYRLAVLGRLPR